MARILQLCVVFAVLLVIATPAMAQGEGGQEAAAVAAQEAGPDALITFSPSFGAAIIILGAGFGIGRIGAAAVESMARQPEAAGDIRGGMVLAAALIEGATFFALIVCIIAIFS